ncbi:MAG: glycosyl hydrolase family 8, partial [Pseudomonadota bacterium]
MRIVSRVSLWGLCLFIWAGVAAAAPSSADIDAARAEYVEQWEEYKRRFLLPDGRIEDTNEGTPSHVEGQGSAMIFATVARDREAFDLIWGWTRDTLWERHGLFAWRYLPNEEVKVPDRNNATDGDLLILWGLMRAAKLWDEPAFDEAADKIILGLERRAIFDVGERKVLLPGALAFRKDDGAILNLSYFLFEPIQWAMERRDNAIWRQTY